MKTVTIPATSLQAARLCLGTNRFGTDISTSAAERLLDAYVEYGGNFIDTAHIYADWIPGTKSASEKLLGQWMKDRGNRQQMIVSTKGGHPELATPHIPRLTRKDLYHDVQESLTFLQTDVIDLYWLHRDDPSTPVEAILDVMNDLVTEGKIRYFGCSNWHVSRMTQAKSYTESNNLHGFVANQPMWSLASPNEDAITDKTMVVMDQASIDYHVQTGMAAIPYSSQAQGFFQKLPDNLKPSDRKLYWNETNLRCAERVKQIAEKHAATDLEVVLSYLLSHPFVTIPIIGSRTVEQLEASLRAADFKLDAGDLALLQI